MKKLTAGIFTVLMGLVSVNAADAAVASKGYVLQETGKVDAKVGVLDSLTTTAKTNVIAAINELKTDLGAVSGADGALSTVDSRLDAIEEYEDAYKSGITSELVGKITTNESAIGVLNADATNAASVAGKIATAIAGLNNAADVNGTADGTYAVSVAQADGVVTTTKASFASTVAEGVSNAPTAGAVFNYVKDQITENNTDVNASIKEAQDAADAAQKDADALEVLVGNTAVTTQISNAIDALDLANAYDAKGAASAAQAAAIEAAAADATSKADAAKEAAIAAAATDATSKANAAQTAAEATAKKYTDDEIAALTLKKISQVPAQCSEPTKYCALTYGTEGFVWEVIERADDEIPLGTEGRTDTGIDATVGQ